MQSQPDAEYFRKFLSPANPIITKQIPLDSQKASLKSQSFPTSMPSIPSVQNAGTSLERNKRLSSISSEQDEKQVERLTLFTNYDEKNLVYRKFENEEFRQRNGKRYFASVFTDLREWPSKGRERDRGEKEAVRFGAEGESMNLFAVYKTGERQYDLILQNDVNTGGYTQWYYFSISNKEKFQTVKLNIVNLYKSKSLYSYGMKPLIFSKKTKTWQRGGTNIVYSPNQINIEYSNKFYHTLSFQYTFPHQNCQTHFAHALPYTYTTLCQKLSSIPQSPKLKIRSLGTTSLKKSIPLLEFSSPSPSFTPSFSSNSDPKKTILFLARQHPGQTPGSFIMQQIITQLLKNTPQIDYLLSKYTIFCVPMLNVDGVILGNYRGNGWGYDLNRCWDREEGMGRVPEIWAMKREIKKIISKGKGGRGMELEFIIDLHGHSRKMGSFFYGNPFGKDGGLFAYVASGLNKDISFEDSTFQKQRSEKITTARVIIGNMINETGSFYTYQTSFFGSNQNNKKNHFTPQHYSQLAKSLLLALYKTSLQLSKEQKTQKQTPFLKQARKEILSQSKNLSDKQSSGSDSQAEKQTEKEMKVKQEQEKKEGKQKMDKIVKNNPKEETQQRDIQKRSIQVQVGNGIEEDGEEKKKEVGYQKKGLKFGSMSQKYSLHVGFQRSQQFIQPLKQNPSDSATRKNYLLQKLRIFGETFLEPPNPTTKQTQTNPFPFQPLNSLNKKIVCSPPEPSLSPEGKGLNFRNRGRKNRNRSLILRAEQGRLGMGDIVKVNRLQYRKIQRNSIIQSKIQKSSISIKQGYLKNILPNINSNSNINININ